MVYFLDKADDRIKKCSENAFRDRFQVSYTDHLVFGSERIRTRVEGKTAKKLQKGKHQLINHWTQCIHSKALAPGIEGKILIREMHPLVGYGVYALQTIPNYTFIGEYTGLVRKRRRIRDRRNNYVFGYVIGPDDTPWVIDAQECGNFTRFLNHSYTPNLTSRWFIQDGVSHIIFFANRQIKKGEQLTYDYGPYYWRRRSGPVTI